MNSCCQSKSKLDRETGPFLMPERRRSFVFDQQCVPHSSKACKVELAQTRADIEAMPNGMENLSIYTDNDIETFRAALFYVGQVLGGFFVINRSGQMELKKYGNQPVLTVERRHRFTSSFSDFITRERTDHVPVFSI